MQSSSILTKSMHLLDLIAAAPAPLTLGEIVDQSGLPKSSTHRLLVLLREAHALDYDGDRQLYRPGSRLMRWGVQTARSQNMATLAAPHMSALCRETGMRIALSINDAQSVLFLHTAETGAPFRLAPRVGQHSPLHASAAGKLFLAEMAAGDFTALMAHYNFEQCTEFTITDVTTLETELDHVKQDGYATSVREEFRQTCGLAVPIRDTEGRLIAALSGWNLGEDELINTLKSHLPHLQDTAQSIRTSLGQTP